MKATGIVRKVDELGRIVIPKEMRRVMQIDNNDPVEIFVDENRIVLSKYVPSCLFCGSDNDIRLFRDKRICAACLAEMKDI